MNYQVELRKSAQRFVRKNPHLREQLMSIFQHLEDDPTPANPCVVRLRGPLTGLYRYRLGDLRIVFSYDSRERVVDVTWIGPRSDAYK